MVEQVIQPTPIFFASLVCNESCTCKVNFKSLDTGKPLSSVLEVHTRFEYTLYGYFMSKGVAFPVVDNYVRDT